MSMLSVSFKFIGLCVFLVSINTYAELIDIETSGFDDSILEEVIDKPDWFKLSFLDIREDVTEAEKNGKKGLILYFGMEKCPYCKALLEVNFAKKDVAEYTQKNFDVVALDVKGNRTVTTLDGKQISEKMYSIQKNANFTPTLVFLDKDGKEVHRMVGYLPLYAFTAGLEYVADRHYKTESFKQYLARGELLNKPEKGEINYREFSAREPYILQRDVISAQRPLLVIFEQGSCHACNVLHAGPFSNSSILSKLRKLDIVQLNMWGDEKLVDVKGEKKTARQWANALGIYYTPTLVFYDEYGQPIVRLASVAHFNRLDNLLNYVTTKGYKKYKNLAEWNNREIRER